MDLYLLRHATAVDVGARGVHNDAARYLNEEGKAEAAAIAKGIARIETRFEAILTSPYPRARQTAEIVAKRLGLETAVESTPVLEPGASLKAVGAEIERRRLEGPVMIVGHNPDFEEMVAFAICSKGCGAINLKKSGLAILRFGGAIAPGRGELRGLLTPEHLQWIGGKQVR